MPNFGFNDVGFVLADGFNLTSSNTVELADETTATLEDIHGAGDSWLAPAFVGLRQHTVTQQGFFDDAAGKINEALAEMEGLSRILCYGVEGNTQGARFVGVQGAFQVNYQRTAGRGVLHRAGAAYESSGPIDIGRVIQSVSAESGAGVTSDGSYDNLASSAAGGEIYLQVVSLTLGGYTSIGVDLEESSNDGAGDAFVSKGAFANVTTAEQAQRITVTGTIERYTRVALTLNGAGSAEEITLLVGLKRN